MGPHQLEEAGILGDTSLVQKRIEEALEAVHCVLHIDVGSPNNGALQRAVIAGGGVQRISRSLGSERRPVRAKYTRAGSSPDEPSRSTSRSRRVPSSPRAREGVPALCMSAAQRDAGSHGVPGEDPKGSGELASRDRGWAGLDELWYGRGEDAESHIILIYTKKDLLSRQQRRSGPSACYEGMTCCFSFELQKSNVMHFIIVPRIFIARLLVSPDVLFPCWSFMFLALFFLVASTQAALTAYYPLDNGAFVDRGAWSLPAGQPVQIRLFFSSPIDSSHLLSFSVSDSLCSLERHSSVTLDPVSNGTVLAIVTLPSADGGPQYFCLDGVHQGTAPWLTVHTFVPTSDAPLIPFALEIVLIVVLLALSGLFSGLNLGLMSLDTTELKIVLSVGSPTEQSYARAIMPLRERGNMLLCTVLLGNVIVNSTLTIFLESVLGSGIFAVLGSAFGIVVVGEIFPQVGIIFV